MNKIKFHLMICSVFILSSAYANTPSNFTTIKGDFNFQLKTDEVILHTVKNGQLEVFTTTKMNKQGEFGFAIPIVTHGFYYIDYGQMGNNRKDQLIRLYLEPGLDMTISIDEKNYTLSGKKVGHNELVRRANKIYDEFAVYAKLGGNVTYEDFYPFLENEGVKMVKDFKNAIDTKDKAFNSLLKLAVQADFEDNCYTFFRMPRTKHPERTNRPLIYKEFQTAEVKFSDPNILQLGNGFDWMANYFFYQITQNEFRGDRLEWISNAIKHMSDDRLKEVYIREGIKKGRYKPDEYKILIKPLYQYLTSEESKEFLITYEKELHKDEGQPGFNFTYHDVNDKPVSFSDFKGKYVYIDVWATWCGPCKREIPFMKELEHDYKGKDIVFVSISVDQAKDKQKWKDFVKTESLEGVQLMADKDFQSGITQNYDINAIPRFLLFDKEGRIISTDAMRPSNTALRNQLDGLLNGPVN